MKKISLLLALCLTLTILSGCGSEPAETTTAPVETTTAPVETTTAPIETTEPQETEPPVEPEVIDFDMELPEGFEATVVQDTITVFSSPNAPMDTSTITVEKLPMDESVLSMTKQEFIDSIPLAVPEETGETEEGTEPQEAAAPEETTEPMETEPAGPEDLNFYSMSVMEIDGWPALYCDYSLEYVGYTSHIYRFEVVVNYCNYVFTFTDSTDTNVWLDSYEGCIPEIDLILDIEGIELDYSGLELYDLKCGLSMYAEPKMESHKAEGFSACIGNRNVIILLMADNKEVNNLTETDLEGYADLLQETNELGNFKWDTYGNLCTTFYSTDEAGMEYYNMICVKETAEDFWVCQIACLADDQAEYARAFSLWASSITAK